jgi:hypothetical protein
MAFSNYGTHNYEVVVPLSLDYASAPIEVAAGSYSSTPQLCHSRHATKTYKFKGMTEAAVKSCLADKRAQYTRRFCTWTRNWTRMVKQSSSSDYYDQVATFNVTRRGDAPVFDLQITVDETVCIYSTTSYDLLTAAGRASLEAQFQRSDLSWVWKYKYDEPGETTSTATTA